MPLRTNDFLWIFWQDGAIDNANAIDDTIGEWVQSSMTNGVTDGASIGAVDK